MTYTLDTNVVAATLRSDRKVMDESEVRVKRGYDVTLNALSYFETRRGFRAEVTRKRRLFEALLKEARVIYLDRPSLDISADSYQNLRRQGTLLEDADSLSAGIAISNGAVLVTRNLKHFERIDGLRLESWDSEA